MGQNLDLKNIKRSYSNQVALLLGFLVPLLSIVHSDLSLVCIVLYLLFFSKGIFELPPAFMPLIAIVLLWVFSDFAFGFDYIQFALLHELSFAAGGLRAFFKLPIPYAFDKAILALKYFSLFILSAYFIRNRLAASQCLKGILIALVLVTCVALIQIFVPEFIQFSNTNSYWESLNRISATFTDPNAFGIFSVLILPLICSLRFHQRYWNYLLPVFICLFIACVSFSGSRSLFLGIAIYLTLMLATKFGWPAVLMLGLTVAIFVTGLNVVGGSAFMEDLIHMNFLPVGVRRIIETISFHHSERMLYSRGIFLYICLLMFVKFPLAGIGFGHFREQLPEFFKIVAANDQLWIDNANNFYFGLLAELGLIGLVVIAVTLKQYKLRAATYDNKAYRYSLLILLCLLFVGPHFEFNEIVLLSAIVIAGSCELTESKKNPKLVWILVLLAVPIIVTHQLSATRGAYPVELDRVNNRQYFWTMRQSQFRIKCENQKARFSLKALQPTVIAKSVAVVIDRKLTMNLVPGVEKEVYLDCKSDSAERLINLEVDQVWVPGFVSDSEDYRPLGVQVVL